MDPDSNLGWFELCLTVKDIARSVVFYHKLGFRQAGGTIGERCVIMQYGACRIALYQGYLENNLLNFRGGDVMEIAQRLEERGIAAKRPPSEDEEGNQSFLIEDPDGNRVYFVHHAGEPPPAKL
jgi:catechol 2,3-dioxygenase-like lactoylglutathione lyase family enzyme